MFWFFFFSVRREDSNKAAARSAASKATARLCLACGCQPVGMSNKRPTVHPGENRTVMKPVKYICVLVFLFSVRREDSNKAAARSAASKATARLCLACGCQPVGMSNKRTTVHPGKNQTVLKPVKHIRVLVFLFFSAPGGFELSFFVFHPDAVQPVCDEGLPV